MNEEYLENIYNALGLQERGIQFEAFKNKISTNKQYNQVIYDNLVQKTGNQYDRASFEVSTGLKKKRAAKRYQDYNVGFSVTIGDREFWIGLVFRYKPKC